MTVRREEHLCGNALQSHLNNQHRISSTWQGADQDPPDLRFDVTLSEDKTETWAVEVTGLVQRYDQEGREDGGNRYDFEPAIFKMVARLNTELGPQMKQGYFLVVTGPLTRSAFRNLESRIRSYVLSGKTEEEALDWSEAMAAVEKNIRPELRNKPDVREVLEKVAKDHVGVTIKGVDGGNKIVVFSGISGVARVPNSGDLAADVDATLNYAVDFILREKMPRMRNVSGYDRKVLLVWKAIPTVSAQDIGEVLSKKVTTGLDGIFVVEGEDRVTMVLNNSLLA